MSHVGPILVKVVQVNFSVYLLILTIITYAIKILLIGINKTNKKTLLLV